MFVWKMVKLSRLNFYPDNLNALNNRKINNTLTGQTITFLQTANDTYGHLLEMEATYKAGFQEPAPHYHPGQVEYFTVLTGALTVRMNNELKVLHSGELLKIDRNQVHSMWNAGTEDTVVNWKVQPALDTEELLRTITGLCNAGRTNERGVPGLLQLSLTVPHFAHVLRLASPPYGLLKIIFFFIKPFALLKGYKATFKGSPRIA